MVVFSIHIHERNAIREISGVFSRDVDFEEWNGMIRFRDVGGEWVGEDER